MSRLVGIVVVTAALYASGSRANVKDKADAASKELRWDPYYALQSAFKKEGYSAPEVKKIQDCLFSDKLAAKHWPFTDHAKALAMSVSNERNNNAGGVAEAITRAGGDPANYNSLTPEVQTSSIATLGQADVPEPSLLQKSSAQAVPADIAALNGQSQANFASIEALTASLSMEAGNVATNTAALARLSTAVASNSAYITELGSKVVSLSKVTGPTMQLATTLGVPISTVASMSLAGAFVGPMLGVIALVYAAWPEEDVDPWLKIEGRVSQMLSNRFDERRRKKLGDRMRRYLKQFSRCSQAWVSEAMVNLNGVTLPRWLVDEAKAAKELGGEFSMCASPTHPFPVPRCMMQLEGHMSIERDEWYGTDTGGLSGLFLPFANMHTQILSVLADNPYDKKMNWGATLKATSAEYGSFMLKHLLGAWRSQVCRSMRLRHSMKGAFNSWKYQFVVLKTVQQPHAAEDCGSACSGKSGWCDFCGGKNEGACCKKGDDGVCKQFDVPVSRHGSTYHACVHTDCIQSNTAYHGTEVKKFSEDVPSRTPEECRQLCVDVDKAVAFKSVGTKCMCFSEDGLKRHEEKGSFSGPTTCKPSKPESARQLEEAYQNKTEELTKVPMEEVEPCEKSPSVANFAELEEKHTEWVQTCYKRATKVMAVEFNEFYLKFAKFVDSLAWKAGCGAQHDQNWGISYKGNGFLAVASTFDGGSFAQCNWNREENNDKNMWVFDDTAARGWTGTSRVNMDEQKTIKMKYPMPSWLHDLKNMQDCMQATAAGAVENPNDIQSTAVGTIMDPVASDSFNEYEQLLASTNGP